jgi:DNA gyrase subunit A
MITIQTTERNGNVVGVRVVGENDELMLITNMGQIIRTRVSEISVYGRNTQGVRVMNTAEHEKIVSIARIREEDLIEDSEAEDEEEVDGEGGSIEADEPVPAPSSEEE